MASLQTVMNKNVKDVIELSDEMALANRWGFLSATQSAAIARAITPHLPCTFQIAMRTQKGFASLTIVDGTGAIHSCTITNRGKIK